MRLSTLVRAAWKTISPHVVIPVLLDSLDANAELPSPRFSHRALFHAQAIISRLGEFLVQDHAARTPFRLTGRALDNAAKGTRPRNVDLEKRPCPCKECEHLDLVHSVQLASNMDRLTCWREVDPA